MELLERQDPDKKKLIEASDRHRKELEKEVKALSDKTEQMLINALVIGGSLALTYFLIRQFTKSKSKKKKVKTKRPENGSPVAEVEEQDESPSVISVIGTKLMNQATLILLDIAKEKLFDYLESRKKVDENS